MFSGFLSLIFLSLMSCGSGKSSSPKLTQLKSGDIISNENTLLDSIRVEEKIYQVVDEMPVFAGCEKMEDLQKRKRCSQEKILQFIFNNLKYPKEAKEQGMPTKMVVNFVIDKKGKVQNVKALRNHNNSLGVEIKRVIQLMPDWNSGKMNGKPVNVSITIPVNIKPEF